MLDEPTSALDPTGRRRGARHDHPARARPRRHGRHRRAPARARRAVRRPRRVRTRRRHGRGRRARPDPRRTRASRRRSSSSVVSPDGTRSRSRCATPAAARPGSPRELGRRSSPPPAVPAAAPTIGRACCAAAGLVVRYGAVAAVRNVDIDLHAGEVVALDGPQRRGEVVAAVGAPRARRTRRRPGRRRRPSIRPTSHPAEARRLVGLVPHTPSRSPVPRHRRRGAGPRRRGVGRRRPATRAPTLDRLAPGIVDDAHPRDLSEGQRLALVLAIQLAAAPRVVLLDEPTRGLDYRAKHELGLILRELAAQGIAVAVSTHDVEFVAASAASRRRDGRRRDRRRRARPPP